MEINNFEQLRRKKLPKQYKDVINFNMNISCFKYCCESIEKIENFDAMINDITCSKWHCHHRLETDKHLSVQQLKDMQMYYYRPASELIFLTSTEHKHIHNKYKISHNNIKQKINYNNIIENTIELNNSRLQDFIHILMFVIVNVIHKYFNNNYEKYFKLVMQYKKIIKYINIHHIKNDKLLHDIMLINDIAFNSLQLQKIFGRNKIGKYIKYKQLLLQAVSDNNLINFKNGTIVINNIRYMLKNRYQIPYSKIKTIFNNNNMLNLVLNVNSIFYTKRQRRLINTQVLKLNCKIINSSNEIKSINSSIKTFIEEY